MDHEEIRRLAANVRCILEANVETLPATFRSFPRACCGDTALVMGSILADAGHDEFFYVWAVRDNPETGRRPSHAWLQGADGLIVDITGDQFKDGPSAVFVSTDSPWHATFEVVGTDPADFRKYTGFLDNVIQVYSVVRRHLDEAK